MKEVIGFKLNKLTTVKDVIDNIHDWRFVTFRTDFDIDMLKNKGYYSAEENLSEGYIFNVARDYFGITGAVWFYGFKGKILRDEYMLDGQDIMIEFRPKEIKDKYNPLPFLIETIESKNYLTHEIYKGFEWVDWELLSEDESRYKYLVEMGAKEYIENTKLESMTAVSDGESFIGVMPRLTKDMIIKVTRKDKEIDLEDIKFI